MANTVKLVAKLLDFSNNPKDDERILISSFRPPYFTNLGYSLQSQTETLFTPKNEQISSEGIILSEGNQSIMVWDNSATTLLDKTSELSLNDDTAITILDEKEDFLYLGEEQKFPRIIMDLETFAAGTGNLIAEYYNGSSFVALSNVTDESFFDVDTWAQNGSIRYDVPTDLATGADAAQAGLDTTLYYIRLSSTTTPTTAPEIDQATPVQTARGPLGFATLSNQDDVNVAYTEDVDYEIDLSSGIIKRISTGSITEGQTVNINYEALSNGIVSIDLSRSLVVHVKIPFSGYDVVADLTDVPSATKELSLESLQDFPHVVS
jgi:hypothetical protein